MPLTGAAPQTVESEETPSDTPLVPEPILASV